MGLFQNLPAGGFAVIVIIAISGPYLRGRIPMLRRRLSHSRADVPQREKEVR